MKPRIISLRRGFFISPVVAGASASVGALFAVTDVLGAPRCVASRGVGFGRRPFCCSVQACLVGVTKLRVEVRRDLIIVTTLGFYAAYSKRPNKPQLIIKRRTDTNDHELLAQAWQAASDKARELGWIV